MQETTHQVVLKPPFSSQNYPFPPSVSRQWKQTRLWPLTFLFHQLPWWHSTHFVRAAWKSVKNESLCLAPWKIIQSFDWTASRFAFESEVSSLSPCSSHKGALRPNWVPLAGHWRSSELQHMRPQAWCDIQNKVPLTHTLDWCQAYLNLAAF